MSGGFLSHSQPNCHRVKKNKSLECNTVALLQVFYSGNPDKKEHKMENVDPTSIPLPEDDNPHQPMQRDIKLPPFWTTRPRAWFTFVESRFRLRGIYDDQSRFDHVLSALPADMVSQVVDIVDTMPTSGLYEHFKKQLLEVHQLSDYEKFDHLIKMEPMGGRKPSQLLHAMLEFCPTGMEKHLSFHYLFMQCLPQTLRVQLGEVQPGDPRTLASRADLLWSVHSPASGSIMATTTTEDTSTTSVAAIRGSSKWRGRGTHNRGGTRGGARSTQRTNPANSTARNTPAADPTPSDLARIGSGLCHHHWTWADKARRCTPPCTWEN